MNGDFGLKFNPDAGELGERIEEITRALGGGQLTAARYHELHAERISLRRTLRILTEGA